MSVYEHLNLSVDESVRLAAHVKAHKVRAIKNRCGSAQAACEAWLKSSLWGDPIYFGIKNIHVYGIWKRDWSQVWVQFTDRYIIIVQPPKKARRA